MALGLYVSRVKPLFVINGKGASPESNSNQDREWCSTVPVTIFLAASALRWHQALWVLNGFKAILVN